VCSLFERGGKKKKGAPATIIVPGALMLLPLVDLSVNEKKPPSPLMISQLRGRLMRIYRASFSNYFC